MDALIDAAADLLTTGGPAAVTLREVGRRAGVSHNAPYKHFADKEELLAAVAARDLGPARRGDPTRGPQPPAGRGTASDAPRVRPPRGARSRAVPLTYGSWQDGSADLGAAATAARAAFVDVVVAAQRDGSLPPGDPERLAALLLALVHGATDLALSGHLARRGKGHADPADLVDDLLAHLGAR